MTGSQLILPLAGNSRREHVVVGPANADAVRFIDSWPEWKVPFAGVYGPGGTGKSHLVRYWQALSGAPILSAEELLTEGVVSGPMAVEDCDRIVESYANAMRLFDLLERSTVAAPVLLTGRERPSDWHCPLPDLVSRLSAMPAFALGLPDDEMLAAIASTLFSDRQLIVPDAVVRRILKSVERTPAAIRTFVDEIDRAALAQSRPISLGLVGEVLAGRSDGVR